jgi:hypothetical protein
LDLRRIAKEFGVLFEVIQVENLIGEVRIHQHIYVKIHVAEYSAIKMRGRINVAIEVPQLTGWFAKPKYVVPTIQPVIFGAESARRNRTQ